MDSEATRMSVVTCHTDDCPNAGVGIGMDLTYEDPETGEPNHVDLVLCGECNNPIFDIEEEPDA